MNNIRIIFRAKTDTKQKTGLFSDGRRLCNPSYTFGCGLDVDR